MDTADIPIDGPSDWRREPREAVSAALLKLGEEASELATRCCRAAMQGANETDPDSGRSNLDHIRDEIADVCALIALVGEFVPGADIEGEEVLTRIERKIAFKRPWLEALRQSDEAFTWPRSWMDIDGLPERIAAAPEADVEEFFGAATPDKGQEPEEPLNPLDAAQINISTL